MSYNPWDQGLNLGSTSDILNDSDKWLYLSTHSFLIWKPGKCHLPYLLSEGKALPGK